MIDNKKNLIISSLVCASLMSLTMSANPLPRAYADDQQPTQQETQKDESADVSRFVPKGLTEAKDVLHKTGRFFKHIFVGKGELKTHEQAPQVIAPPPPEESNSVIHGNCRRATIRLDGFAPGNSRRDAGEHEALDEDPAALGKGTTCPQGRHTFRGDL